MTLRKSITARSPTNYLVRRKTISATSLYQGATTCDLAPAWRDTCPDLLAMLMACYAADPDEQTPFLVLADMLQERGDPRERWVRAGARMWEGAAALPRKFRALAVVWNYDQCKNALAPVCQTEMGWRLAGLWGCLVAWHSPTGDGSGNRMGRTWADERLRAVQRCLWFWALGFLETNPIDAAWSQADAAGSQADAAWRQADAAGSQGYAAWSQAYAAWRQADAAGRQADAAGSQADAAWRQADAAGSQAYAAWRQADAAGSQADAAWRQADAAGSQAYAAGRQAYAAGSQAYAAGRQADVWKFARAVWVEVCQPEIEGLNH